MKDKTILKVLIAILISMICAFAIYTMLVIEKDRQDQGMIDCVSDGYSISFCESLIY